MGAKIFISWSGELSKALGEAVRDWIPMVLQSVKPYFTPDDIEKGARWSKEISQELASSQLGIICLTQENQNNPWILFESGALSKNLEESKVCPVLFNFDTTDLKGPLASFQATKFNKEDFKKLLESINNSCNDTKLDQIYLDETFEMWWPRLDNKIKELLAQDITTPKPKKRTDRDILEEILELTRSNSKTFYSESKVSLRIMVEDLVISFRHLKDKVIRGVNPEMDILRIDNILGRLCSEANLDSFYKKLGGIRTFSSYGAAEILREKNSVNDFYFVPTKKKNEDETEMDSNKCDTEDKLVNHKD